MKYSKLVFVLLIALIHSQSFCQDNPRLTPLIESLGKSNKTVSRANESSGILDVPIELFTLNSHGVPLSIVLNYNGQGLQVQRGHSRVGQGWSLNIGGEVKRNVIGVADDIPFNDDSHNDRNLRGFLNHGKSLQALMPNNHEKQMAGVNMYDYQPDHFIVTSPSGGGSFFLSRGDNPCGGEVIGEVVEIPQTSLDINVDYHTEEFTDPNQAAGMSLGCFDFKLKLDGFEVSDEIGTKYSYYDKEYFKSDLVGCSGVACGFVEYFNEWHLSQIHSRTGQLAYDYDYFPSYIESYNAEHQTLLNGLANDVTTAVKNYEKYIDKIVFENGEVRFINETINSKPFLSFIDVYKNGERIKRIQFLYSEFGTISSDPNDIFLSEIRFYEFDYDELVTPTPDMYESIKFDYYDYGGYAASTNSIDHWGFFNNEENQSLITSLYETHTTCARNVQSRAANLESTREGALREIVFSTGSSEEFEYELHDYSRMLNESTEFQTGNNNPAEVSQYCIHRPHPGSIPIRDPYDDTVIWSWMHEPEETFLIEFSQTITATVDWIDIFQGAGCGDAAHCFTKLEFRFDRLGSDIANSPIVTFSEGNVLLSQDVFLEAGEYHIRVRRINTGNLCYEDWEDMICPDDMYLTLNHITQASQNQKAKIEHGGLRVKSITKRNNNGQGNIISYDYTYSEDPSKSSGIALYPVSYGTLGYDYEKDSNGDTSSQLAGRTSSITVSPFYVLSRQGIFYTDVASTISDLNNEVFSSDFMGSVRSKYIFDESCYPNLISGSYSVSNRFQLPAHDPFSGKLSSRKYFDVNLSLVAEEIFEYDYLKESNEDLVFAESFGIDVHKTDYYTTDFTNYHQMGYDQKRYSIESKFPYLKSKIKRYYNDSESIVEERRTDFSYNPEILSAPYETIISDDHGNKYSTVIKFPIDYDVSGSLTGDQALSISKFTELGMPAIPIEEQYFKILSDDSKELLSSTINFYKIESTTETPLLVEVLGSDLSTPIENYTSSRVNNLGEFNFYSEIFSSHNILSLYSEVNEPIEVIDAVGTTTVNYRSVDDRYRLLVERGQFASTRYTSFESEDFGGWDLVNANFYVKSIENISDGPSYAPSGNKVYKLVGTSHSEFNSKPNSTKFLPGTKYILSYYRNDDGVFAYAGDQQEPDKVEQRGEWEYVETIFSCTEPSGCWVTITGEGYIDEVRIHEVGASMSTTGFYPNGRKMYRSGELGGVISYEYDIKGRLEWVLDTEKNVIEHRVYEDNSSEATDSYNKIAIYSARDRYLPKTDFIDEVNSGDVSLKSVFSDGWGRLAQTHEFNVSGSHDLVSFFEYDPLGREVKFYEPYSTNLSSETSFIETAKADQENYFLNTQDPNEATTYPFTEIEYEISPLQRPKKVSSIGEEFSLTSDHATRFRYAWNVVEEPIRKWEFYSPNGAAASSTVYSEGKLKRNVVINPNGDSTVTFINSLGQKVAEGAYVRLFQDSESRKVCGTIDNSGSSIELILTYFVYDSFGRLIYLIPPNAIEAMRIFDEEQIVASGHPDYEKPYEVVPWANNHSNNHQSFISFYEYDNRGRLKREKNPGQKSIKYYYDKKDRLILEHLPRHAEDVYHFFKYDSRDRIILTGEVQLTGVENMQSLLDQVESPLDEIFAPTSLSSNFGYTNDTYPPISEDDVLQVFYFDDYSFSPPQKFAFYPFEGNSEATELTRTAATGSLTRVLNSNDEVLGEMLLSVSYFDQYGRLIQAFTENHKGGYDRISTVYNERNQVKKTLQFHKFLDSSDPINVSTEFFFRNISGELVNIRHQVDNDSPVWISEHQYDDAGKLKKKKLHKRSAFNYLQNIDYRYNERGQLTHINNPSLVKDIPFNGDDDDVFGQEIMYHKLSPEARLEDAQEINQPEPNFIPDYTGNISAMIWNAKTPDEDGAELDRHLYTYEYDEIGQLIEADYGRDIPANPGQFKKNYGRYSTNYNYDLGGNITQLRRRIQNKFQYTLNDGSGNGGPAFNSSYMDDLSFIYENDGFQLSRVDESSNGNPLYSTIFPHFVDGVQQSQEYSYDNAGRNTVDLNRGITTSYNRVNRPHVVEHDSGSKVTFIYDAAGNKLQKIVEGERGGNTHTIETDYVGNFLYHYGNLEFIYHPEGVIRKADDPSDAGRDYHYDYFIRDYLGNVRVVISEEDGTEEVAFLSTLEDYYAELEAKNFDNLDESRSDLPENYPVNGSAELNERIAYLIAEDEMVIGPSIVLETIRGAQVDIAVDYFYEEDAPGATYDNLGFLVNEVLVSLAASAAGVVPIPEAQLNNIASGNTALGGQIFQLLSSSLDTNNLSRPQGYLVYLAFNKDDELIQANSGAVQVTTANQLETILRNGIIAKEDGYMHIYLSNGSSEKGVSFDNLYVTMLTGKVRQINHYYPYGLPIAGLEQIRTDYLSKYTGKEHQTGEFAQFGASSRGIEMYDFDARFWDPQLARWVVPDPAHQFSNPYLGIGNNPILYQDPNGEWIHIAVGALIGGAVNLGMKAASGQINSWGDGFAAFGIGAAAGAIGAATGGAAFLAAGGGAAGAGGFIAGAVGGMAGSALSTPVQSIGNHLYFGDPLMTPEDYVTGVLIGGALGGTFNGVSAIKNGKSFLDGTNIRGPQLQPAPSLPANDVKSNVPKKELATRDQITNQVDNSSSGQSVQSEIKKAIPDNGNVNYKTSYFEKVTGDDGNHNWNRVTLEIVSDNGQVFPNSVGLDGKPQVLIQMVGDKYGTSGVFEIVIRDGAIHHQRFIPGGVVNGIPNQIVPGAPGGVKPPFPWWQTR